MATKKKGPKKMELADELNHCLQMIREISKKPEAEPFREPVDWKTLGLFDYPKIIKRPMDLGTIEKKCRGGGYEDAWGFAEDMRLVWENAKTYNRPGSGIYLVAEQLQDCWERKFKKIQKRGTKRTYDETVSDDRDTDEARFRFTELIKKLNSDQIGTIVDLIEKGCPKALHEEDYEEDLEIEVSEIDLKTLQHCNQYAEECVNSAKRRKKGS